MHATLRAFCVALALVVCLSPIRAQAPRVLRTVHGIASPEALGSELGLAALNDVDGDGVPDFVAGAPGWPLPSPTQPGTTIAGVGRAGVYSGASGALLFSVFGTANLQALGRAVANIGDVDGDLRDDIAIGAPMFGPTAPGVVPPPAQVQVWSTGTQSLLYTVLGGPGGFSSTNFGAAIAGLSDVGSLVQGQPSLLLDGVRDFAVGAPDGDAVWVHSGADGGLLVGIDRATLNTQLPPTAQLASGDRFGGALAAVGDLDGDGRSEILVGARLNAVGGTVFVAPNTWTAGAAYLLSGRDGTLVQDFYGAPGDQFGYAVAGGADFDGDLVPDFAVSRPRSDLGGVDAGAVTAYSGATRQPLWTTSGLAAGDLFGWALSLASDIDHDGISDLVVGAPASDVPATNAGSATVLSGRDGSRLAVIAGAAATDLRGRAVSGFSDLDGDGSPEILVGTPGSDVGGNSTGSIAIVSTGPFLGPAADGTEPLPAGGVFEPLRVQGSTGGAPRRIDVSPLQPIAIDVIAQPFGSLQAPFYLFGFLGRPTPADTFPSGIVGLAPLAFPPPLFVPSDPRLFLLANSFAVIDPSAILPSTSPGPFAFTLPLGLPAPFSVALQGVTFDGLALWRTNAVLIEVR